RACVEARVRRSGIATQLVRAAESHLQQLGCRKINLQIHSDNASALAFWRRLGYLEEPRVSMGKDLGMTNAPGNRRNSGTLNLQFPGSDEGAT
ncbi:MAG: GNAT family N-acetyltransferase, partial [Myxococcales bacterium]|nr:GNAT family N-acetyltransferase [Myxococcales bacterium]